MGIFRPNKLGYTSEDVEKKSNSYIMTVVEKFTYNINKIVEAFKSEVKGVIEQQDSDISDIDAKYENITGEIKRNLNMEIAQREGTNAMHDSQITELYSKKADKTEVEGLRNDKADKSTTLAGYGITDAYSQDYLNRRFDSTESNVYDLTAKVTSNSDRIDTVETSIGDIETAIDGIIAIQNSLIGGGTA